MDSTSIQTHPWVQSYLDEQCQLIIEFLSLPEQGGIPSDITLHHMRAWILSNARTALLNSFQEMAEGNHLHLIELVWKVRACLRLREIEQGVLRELQPCKSSPSSIQTHMAGHRLVTKMASPCHERPAPSSLMSGNAEKLPEKQVDLSRNVTHATLQRALSDMASREQRAQTQTRRTPSPIVVHSQSIKHIISQVLLQVNHEAFRNGVCLKTVSLLPDTQDLLWSFPWVQITEEKQLANTLLQSSAVYQVAKAVLERLEQVLAPRPVLARALVTSSNIFSHYLVHLVALSIAQLVPDQLSADQEERLVSERAAAAHPLPPKLVISRELVEDFLVKFLLRLHPLNGRCVKQLTQQALLAMTLEMSAVTLATLERVPGVSVDRRLPAPLCNTRRAVLQLQSAMVKKFGTVIEIKRPVAMKDPEALTFIPNGVIEGVLRIYRSLREAGPAGVTCCGETGKAVEDAMDEELFSQLLPETLRKRLFQQYGAWVRHMATFQRAFPKITDQDIISYRRKVLRPRPSNRDVVWVDPKYSNPDDEEEGKVPSGSLMKNPLALDCSLAAFNRQFPKAQFFVDITHLLQADLGVVKPSAKALGQGDTGVSSHPQSGSKAAYDFGPLLPPAQSWAGDCPEVPPTTPGTQSLETTPLNSRRKEEPIVALDKGRKVKPLVQVSTITKVLTAVFKRPSWAEWDFNEMMVEHIYLLLQRETERYRHNRVFLNTLQRLTDPEREAKLGQAVASSVKDKVLQHFPRMLLCRASLLETPQIAVIFCSIVASELTAHLKPSVSFAKGTKKGDSTPYSVNLPLKRETSSSRNSDRPQTRLEIQVETHRRHHLEKLRSPVVKDPQYWKNWDLYNESGALPREYEELGQMFLYKRKKKRSCFCGLFRW